VTPTPTPSGNFCSGTGLSFSLSGYTPVVPTVTLTPSVTLTNTVPVAGQVTFNMLENTFTCVSVKVLKICETGLEVYTTDSLMYFNLPITTGTTMLALVNGNQQCITYVRDDSDYSSNTTVGEIYTVYGNCDTCSILPTPTPTITSTSTPTVTPTSTLTQTPTNTSTQTPTPSITSIPGSTPPVTPTPTMTNTPTNTNTPTQTKTGTPTPTPTPNWVYVFQTCQPLGINTQNSMIIQTLPHGLLLVGEVIKYLGDCWIYLGKYETNYTPPIDVISSTFQGDYFSSVTTNFSNCNSCLSPPTPVVELSLAQISESSDISEIITCGLPLPNSVQVSVAIPEMINVGDIVYNPSFPLTPFIGDNNFWHIKLLEFPSTYSVQIGFSGENAGVINQISICP
jgi:hypothetical protein